MQAVFSHAGTPEKRSRKILTFSPFDKGYVAFILSLFLSPTKKSEKKPNEVLIL